MGDGKMGRWERGDGRWEMDTRGKGSKGCFYERAYGLIDLHSLSNDIVFQDIDSLVLHSNPTQDLHARVLSHT
eukprot:1009597-Amorphochlora_amoeboformis.AAC.1